MSLTWPVVVPDAVATRRPWSTSDPADRARASALAVQILWSLTGQVLGTTEVSVRPCFGPPDDRTTYAGTDFASGPGFWPGLMLGNPAGLGPCGCASADCNAGGANSVALPGPVVAVTSVQIDDTILDPSHYRVSSRRWLIRTDGHGWPQRQNLNAAAGTLGAFAITYTRGIPVSAEGQWAAGLLANEILVGLGGGDGCRLPPNVTSLAREGVNIEFDPAAFLDSGLTGLSDVDRWVASLNPSKVRTPPRITIPGERGRFRR